jgi:sporulation protein YlmC with PRC-barrel domain
MNDVARSDRLVKLGDSALSVADPAADVRGRTVLAQDGEPIGKVDDLFVDERRRRVRFLQVAAGGVLGLGERHVLLPVEAVTRVDADHVHVDQTRQRIAGAPRYDPRIEAPPDYYAGVYEWFGAAPFWNPVEVPHDSPVREEIPVGTEVVGSDGEKVGEIVAAFRDYVVVQTGVLFPSDRYVPTSALAGDDGERVKLVVTKTRALEQPWRAIPPSTRGVRSEKRERRGRGRPIGRPRPRLDPFCPAALLPC